MTYFETWAIYVEIGLLLMVLALFFLWRDRARAVNYNRQLAKHYKASADTWREAAAAFQNALTSTTKGERQ